VDILIKTNGGLELKNILSIENDEEPLFYQLVPFEARLRQTPEKYLLLSQAIALAFVRGYFVHQVRKS